MRSSPRSVISRRDWSSTSDGVLLEDLVPAAAGGVLQLEDRLRAEQVRLALAPPLVLAARVQPPVIHPGARARWRGRSAGRISSGELVEAHAGQPRGGAGEAGLDHLRAQADGLEDLRAGVGGDGGHAHLGHDLQQALAEGLEQVGLGLLLGYPGQHARAGPGP